MALDVILGVADRLVAIGSGRSDDLVGCTNEEIRRVEDAFGVPLPGMYRAFLQVMGKQAARLFTGTTMFFPYILRGSLRDDLRDLLREEGVAMELRAEDLVFYEHGGYIYRYMPAGHSSEDPAVYEYVEGRPSVQLIHDSFSRFLTSEVDAHESYLLLRRKIEASRRRSGQPSDGT